MKENEVFKKKEGRVEELNQDSDSIHTLYFTLIKCAYTHYKVHKYIDIERRIIIMKHENGES